MTTDFYTPQSEWSVQQYGYWPGNTYMINGYRMYLAEPGYWYFVDHPDWLPLRASRRHYRTGGIPGVLFKWFGVMALIAGIGLMFGDTGGFIAAGSILLTLGLFGTILAITDSVRNHPEAWKVLGVAIVAAYVIHETTDGD